MEIRYPYHLTYVTKSPIWGGTRLSERFGIRSDAPTVGEAWMLTVRAAENSSVANGPLAGRELGKIFSEYGNALIGNGDYSAGFPLLIKLIDATDRLSVQVHPDDEYAKRVENDRGKTEMWYIVDAEPGAEIIYGLKDGVGNKEFREQVEKGNYEAVMRHQPVHAGETYFIPSGMLHAIGKGILIAEIQQNCDLTYRVYDYGRLGKDGKPRELHVGKAMDVTRPFTEEEIRSIRFGAEANPDKELLAACRYFRVRHCDVTGERDFSVGDNSFVSLLCVAGNGEIRFGGESYPVHTGDSYFLPAGMGNCTLRGNGLSVLLSSLS